MGNTVTQKAVGNSQEDANWREKRTLQKSRAVNSNFN